EMPGGFEDEVGAGAAGEVDLPQQAAVPLDKARETAPVPVGAAPPVVTAAADVVAAQVQVAPQIGAVRQERDEFAAAVDQGESARLDPVGEEGVAGVDARQGRGGIRWHAMVPGAGTAGQGKG